MTELKKHQDWAEQQEYQASEERKARSAYYLFQELNRLHKTFTLEEILIALIRVVERTPNKDLFEAIV